MRTTILLEDNLGKAAQRRARQEGLSLSALISRALEGFLAQRPPVEDVPFRLITVGEGGTQPGVDLDRTSALLAAEDEPQYTPRRRKG